MPTCSAMEVSKEVHGEERTGVRTETELTKQKIYFLYQWFWALESRDKGLHHKQED